MKSITAFPPQPNIESAPSWKVVQQDMELSQFRAPDIGTLVYRAFAVVIWAYTGDKTVSFVAARCSQASLDDVAVHEYEHSGTELDDGNLVHVGRTALGRLPSSRSIIIQCRDEPAACME